MDFDTKIVSVNLIYLIHRTNCHQSCTATWASYQAILIAIRTPSQPSFLMFKHLPATIAIGAWNKPGITTVVTDKARLLGGESFQQPC
ncbi:hypothetical protein VIGAN_04265000 [Vigna angularis var. angularis]|uniref:Uncharacterized protein n=1 Tax=Vigna angularis var. angularis TaxID=157739 RepID=A0A0S3RX31_PHAAN|nr:hypothetical protein VIGAN_04265000 [Vigna angularis var. angularis]